MLSYLLSRLCVRVHTSQVTLGKTESDGNNIRYYYGDIWLYDNALFDNDGGTVSQS